MNSDFPSLNNSTLCAVIVTYHPDAGFSTRFESLRSQINKIIVVDNGSDEQEQKLINNLNFDNKVLVIKNHQNLGIAAALNIGVKKALEMGYLYTILFDQDSEPYSNCVAELISTFLNIPQQEKVAVLTCSNNQSKNKTTEIDSAQYYNARRSITSGSLVPIYIYKKVGWFREDFFIDAVDTEFCFRARKLGYKIYKTKKILMNHTIGNPKLHNFFGLQIKLTHHNAMRKYYMARNYLLLDRMYPEFAKGWWVKKAVMRYLEWIVCVLLYEENKLEKIIAITKGYKHAINSYVN